jgi:hypothetical protein
MPFSVPAPTTSPIFFAWYLAFRWSQINANSWAISVRGLNSLFSNDVVVMVDGRTVYVSTFGDVFWDALDLSLEDIG